MIAQIRIPILKCEYLVRLNNQPLIVCHKSENWKDYKRKQPWRVSQGRNGNLAGELSLPQYRPGSIIARAAG
jgi:hypothetical protein